MTPIDTLCESAKLRLIANALGLQHCTKTAACIIPIPNTERMIAIGTKADVVRLLELDAVAATTQASTAQAEIAKPVAALTEAGRAVLWHDEYGYEPLAKHYRPLYLAATSSTDAQAAAEVRDAALEEAAKLCDSMHERISDPLLIGEDRAEAAHNVLTNVAKAIRALRAGDTGSGNDR